MTDANGGLPVTLLAGFLGAGKTTLLNYILSQNHGRRIAVIENEFGEIPVDHHLVIGAEDDIFEMNNGCVCCSIRSDLIETLNRLIERHDPFDAVLIECTGLASPAPIAQAFLVEGAVSTSLTLDGVVTLVDCLNIERQLGEIEVAWEQIAFSNVILLNKTDLAPAAGVERLRKRLAGINPLARFHETVNAMVDLSDILHIGGFNLDASRPLDIGAHPANPGADHGGITSVGVSLAGEIDWNRFCQWLQMLLITDGMDVFRAKGVLALPGEDERFIFQSVYMMIDGRPDNPWGSGPRLNELVFIGRDLDRQRLEAGVRACLSSA